MSDEFFNTHSELEMANDKIKELEEKLKDDKKPLFSIDKADSAMWKEGEETVTFSKGKIVDSDEVIALKGNIKELEKKLKDMGTVAYLMGAEDYKDKIRHLKGELTFSKIAANNLRKEKLVSYGSGRLTALREENKKLKELFIEACERMGAMRVEMGMSSNSGFFLNRKDVKEITGVENV